MTNWRKSSRLVKDETGYGGVEVACGASGSLASWSQRVTSTNYDYYGFFLQFQVQDWSGYQCSIDIGIGTSGSEKTLVREFMLEHTVDASKYGVGQNIYFPFFIPAGSNLHFRGRTNHTSGLSAWMSFYGIAESPLGPLCSQSEYFNVNTGTPAARQTDCGGTANTWTSWATLQDNTLDFDAKYVMIYQGTTYTYRSTCSFESQLGIGSSGSEQVIANWDSYTHASGDYHSGPYIAVPVQIPSGTTLRHRSRCTITSSPGRIISKSYYFFG